MTFVAAFLASAARHLRGAVPDGSAKPLIPPALCHPVTFQPKPVKTLKDQSTMFSLTRSPLVAADDLSPRAIDAILAVFADGEVQRHVAAVRGKLLRLVEIAALRSEVAAAIAAIGTHATDLTPAAVVAVLRQRAAELDDALDDARDTRDTHESVRKARALQKEPLRREVSARLTALVAEREHCDALIVARRRAADMPSPAGNRHQALLAAGLSQDQIKALGPDYQSVGDQEAVLKERIAKIDIELAPLREFSESGDVAHLAGLGFNDLIAKAHPERATEGVAA